MTEPAPERIFTVDFTYACLGSLAAFGSFYLLLATLPVYVLRIGGRESEVGLIIGVFSASALLVRLWVGREADARGRKGLILVGAAILVASALGYHLAVRSWILLALRIVHGAGWAFYGTGLQALVADVVPPKRRGEAMGYFGMFANLAMASGPAFGVFVMQRHGFPELFDASAVVALVGLVVAFPLREPPRPPRAADAPRSAVLERTAFAPAVVLCLFSMTYGAIVTFVAVYAGKQGLGNPGYFFTTFAITLVLVRPLTGALSDRRGRGAVIVPGLLVTSGALLTLAGAGGAPAFLGSAVLYALGFAAVQPALMALVIDRAPPDRRGAAMGTFSTAMDLGISIGSFVWGVVAQRLGFPAMYAACAAVALVALGAYALSIRERASGEAR